jgi:hypothetical protein
MSTIPRYTKGMQSHAMQTLAAWQMAVNDPVLQGAWRAVFQTGTEESIHALAMHLRERHANLGRQYGDALDAEITAFAQAYHGDTGAFNAPICLQRYTPDNPIQRLPDGGHYLPPGFLSQDWKVALTYLGQARNYERTLMEAGKRGRRPTHTQPPASRLVRLNPAQSLRAYNLQQAGRKWEAIYKALFDSAPPRDTQGRERARGRIRRLVSNGRRLQNFSGRI